MLQSFPICHYYLFYLLNDIFHMLRKKNDIFQCELGQIGEAWVCVMLRESSRAKVFVHVLMSQKIYLIL